MSLEALQQGQAAQEITNNTPAIPAANEGAEPTEAELLSLLDDETPAQGQPQAAPVKPEDNPLSSKFAELAKMESKYQKQIREMKEKLEGFESNSKDKLTRDELLEQLRNDYKKNPKRFLEENLDGSYDQLSDFILNEEDRIKDYESNEKVSTLEKKIQDMENMLQTKEQTEKQKQLEKKEEEYKGNLKNFMKQSGDDFSIISSLGEEGTVYDVMQNHFEETGKVLSPEEACKQVEDYYIEKMKTLAALPKVKNLFNFDNNLETTKQPPQATSDENGQQFNGQNTITNDFVSNYSESDLENMSDEERMRLAESIL